MEKVRPWCGQPSDRGRLKNRTEQAQGRREGDDHPAFKKTVKRADLSEFLLCNLIDVFFLLLLFLPF